jgi:hypothetical protein
MKLKKLEQLPAHGKYAQSYVGNLVDILVPLLFQGTNTEMPPYFMRGQINA